MALSLLSPDLKRKVTGYHRISKSFWKNLTFFSEHSSTEKIRSCILVLKALCHRCIGRIDFDIMQRSIERVREGANGDINLVQMYSMYVDFILDTDIEFVVHTILMSIEFN